MNSDSDLVLGVLVRLPFPPLRDFVAVLATARLVSTECGASLPECGWIASRDRRGRAAADQPEHDRLRPRPRVGGDPGAGRDAASDRPRRPRARCNATVPPLCNDLGDFTRR